MSTIKHPDEFNRMLDLVIDDENLRATIKQYALAEFRRGYLLGQREMKQMVENAVAGLQVAES